MTSMAMGRVLVWVVDGGTGPESVPMLNVIRSRGATFSAAIKTALNFRIRAFFEATTQDLTRGTDAARCTPAGKIAGFP